MKSLALCAGISVCVPTANAGFTLASGGKPRCVVVQQADATAPEQHAIAELVAHLGQITGARFEVQTWQAELAELREWLSTGKTTPSADQLIAEDRDDWACQGLVTDGRIR